MDWPRTQGIYTFSWSMSLEESYLLISEQRPPSILIRLGKDAIMIGSMQPR
jgi:hypothetical protein